MLQALVEQSLELIAITDGAGTITWANSRFSAATGVSGGKAIRLIDCAAEGAAGDSTREKLGAGLAAGTLETSGLRLRTIDDSPLWVDVRARRAAERVLWTFTDVSSTRFLAAQARRQGELLDTAQEFGRIGLWERRIPSGEGRWDRHVFGFWGLDPAAGTPPFEEAIRRIHPDDRVKMIYAESTQRAGRYSQRYRVIQPDGKTRLIHSQWAVKNGPQGTPDRAVGIMMDDTEAYESARALVDVNAQLKLAVDLGQIAIWRHDLRTQRMHYSDRAFQLLQQEPRPEGFSIEEVRSFIHPDDIALVLASAEKALASDQPTDMEVRYRRVDGSYRYVMTRRVVERDEAGEPLAFVGVALDVTERVEQRQQAEELARRLEAASHAAGIGLWTTAIDPPETDWNAQTFAIFDRFAPPRVPGLSEWLSECVHPDDRERVGERDPCLPDAVRRTAGDRVPHPAPRRQRPLGGDARRHRHGVGRAAAHPRRGHRRDRAARRARGAARRQRALGADRPPRRHRHVGGAARWLAGALGRADVPPARPGAVGEACRTARNGWRWSIPTTCRGCSMPAPAPSAPRWPPPTSSGSACPTAAGAGWPRARRW